MHVCVYVCVCAYLLVYACTHRRTRIQIQIYVCMYVCICVCIKFLLVRNIHWYSSAKVQIGFVSGHMLYFGPPTISCAKVLIRPLFDPILAHV